MFKISLAMVAPVCRASRQSLATSHVLTHVCIELLVVVGPRKPGLGCHTDGIVLSDKVEDLVNGTVDGGAIVIHEQEDEIFELVDALRRPKNISTPCLAADGKM